MKHKNAEDKHDIGHLQLQKKFPSRR